MTCSLTTPSAFRLVNFLLYSQLGFGAFCEALISFLPSFFLFIQVLIQRSITINAIKTSVQLFLLDFNNVYNVQTGVSSASALRSTILS